MKNASVFCLFFLISTTPALAGAESWRADSSLWSDEVVGEVFASIGDGEHEGARFINGLVSNDVLFICENQQIASPIRSVVAWVATPLHESVSNQWSLKINISYESDSVDASATHIKSCFEEATSILKPKEVSLVTDNIYKDGVYQFTVETDAGLYDLFIPLKNMF